MSFSLSLSLSLSRVGVHTHILGLSGCHFLQVPKFPVTPLLDILLHSQSAWGMVARSWAPDELSENSYAPPVVPTERQMFGEAVLKKKRTSYFCVWCRFKTWAVVAIHSQLLRQHWPRVKHGGVETKACGCDTLCPWSKTGSRTPLRPLNVAWAESSARPGRGELRNDIFLLLNHITGIAHF